MVLKKADNQKKIVISLCLLLIVSILAIYAQTGFSDFVDHDDHVYVQDNPHVSQGLTWNGIVWAFTTMYEGNWFPLLWISLMLDTTLFGAWAGGFHLTNVAFHIANSILMFWILFRFTKTLWLAFFVAALFALHPLHVESVAWVTERKDTLSAFFWLLTMLCYLRYVEVASVKNYNILCLIYALGLMSKSMLVTLPFILLLLDYWPLQRFPHDKKTVSFKNLVREKAPLIILASIVSVITIIAQHSGQAIIKLNTFPFFSRLGNASLSYFFYIFKTFLPTRLACFYPLPNEIDFFKVAIAAIFLIIITAAVISQKRRRYLLVGWFWYIITLLPVIGIIQVGGQAMADRYTYIPLTGIFIIIVWLAAELCEKFKISRMLIGVSVCLLFLMLGTWSFIQTCYWHDSFALFSHAANVTKDNYYAYRGLGIYYAQKGQMQKAAQAFEKVANIQQQNPYILFRIAQSMEYFGQTDEAVRYYDKVLEIVPDNIEAITAVAGIEEKKENFDKALKLYSDAIKLKPDNANLLSSIGLLYLKMGLTDEGINELKKASDIGVNSSIYGNLAIACLHKEQPQQALEYFNKALVLDYTSPQVHFNLANFYSSQGKSNEAVNEYEMAVKFDPRYSDAHENLAIELAQQGRIDDAIEHFKLAALYQPANIGFHLNLAKALTLKGLTNEAAGQFRIILALDPNHPGAREALNISQQ